ncbi:hypothetical protein PP175_25625 (plasmid) [Aneurinibacillus sp. Ricciae_BoGa-3]|uniref:hypothetical protein n=1 Tax=Aneurinibacillus sp. Ricciae_BoGa-3 TaxID=3022697 RepID=UPI002340F127|nr:hypothetical protein [Aneurinibacillus sp. Ricciae_BoGa-3]WCK57450.1 hypothetical protein PP175_25625 [Aneurinibacillus sp. Ricciae_BoGa-3]
MVIRTDYMGQEQFTTDYYSEKWTVLYDVDGVSLYKFFCKLDWAERYAVVYNNQTVKEFEDYATAQNFMDGVAVGFKLSQKNGTRLKCE